MSNQEGKSWFDQANQVAEQLKKAASDASSQAGQLLEHATSQVQQTTSEVTGQISQAISGSAQTSQSPDQAGSLDLAQVDEAFRLAFYGALFAIATVDGQVDKEEMEHIFGMMDLENMSEEAKRQVQSYVINPPTLQDCLKKLAGTDERLRFGLMVNLVETACANDEVDLHEKQAILLAQKELNITNKQLGAIITFVKDVRAIRARGLDDDHAADAMKSAAAGLGAVGVPIAAIYLSGSVVGLSAAGITSGLAAIGLGFGMVPGIGVLVLVGAGIFLGVSKMLDVGDDRAKEEARLKQERKAQLVIQNMHASINQLIEQIASLQEKAANLQASAADAEANREAVRILTDRLKFMQQSINKRKQAVGAL